MKKEKRKSGISVVGDVPWGTHLCQFYKTKEDLLDILVPYFKAGLENNEFCMWVTSEPLNVEEAKTALGKVVKDLDDYINKGQLEILDYSEWYTKNGKFDSGRILEGWVEKEKYAVQNGFDGLRLTGNTFWLVKNDWDDFKSYEETVNNVIDKHRMIAICLYSLEKCNASEIIDVVSNHQFAIIRRESKWNIIKSSERKKAEGQLKNLEERYTNLMELAPDSIVTVDLKGYITSCNSAATRIFRYSKDDLVGKHFSKIGFFHVKDIPKYLKLFVSLLQGKSTGIHELTVKDKDGTARIVETHIGLIKENNKISGVIAITRDITERRKAEEEIKKERDFSKSIVNIAQAIVMVLDTDGKIVSFNPYMEELSGYKIDEVKGKDWFTTFLPECDYDPIRRLFKKSLRDIQTRGNINPIIVKDGREILIEWFDKTLKDKDGKIIGILEIGQNVTERKKTEEMLKKSEERYKKLFNSSPELIIENDEEGNILAVNSAMAKHLGVPLEKLIGKNVFDIFPGEIAEERAKIAKKAHEEMKKLESKDERAGRYFHNVYVPIVHPDGKKTIQIIIRDITEQKKAEDALRESEEKFRTIFENNSSAMAIIERDTTISMVNRKYCELSLYEEQDVIGMSWTKQIHPEDLERLKEYNRRRLIDPKNAPREYEFKFYRKDGETRHCLMSVDILPTSQKIITSFIDITERKKAQEEIKSLAKFTSENPNPVLRIKKDGEVVYSNKTGFQILDFWKTDIGEEVPERWHNIIRKKFTSKNLKAEEEEEINDKIFSFAVSPVADEGYVNLYGRDITKRKKAENALRQSEEKYHTIADFTYGWETWLGADGKYLYVSPSCKRITGYHPDDFISNPQLLEKITHSDDRKKIKNHIHEEIKENDKKPTHIDFRIITSIGEERWINHYCQPVHNKEGVFLGTRASNRDITERKAVEEKIKKQNVQLKKLDRIKTDFLNTTSHELRTPVASIKGYIQMLLKQTLGEITEEQKKALEVLLRNTNRLDHLIQDILDISRLESETMKFITEKTDVTKMVKEVAETMQTSADLKRIKIKIDIQKEIPDLMIDSERIKQVLINLVDNAIKFSPDGSMINIKARKEKEDLLFEVQDFGRGIPKNKQKKIFERFYQVDSGIDRKFGGIGLGLTISKKIIETYGGQIWVDSTVGKGSLFKFSVPLQSAKNVEGDLQDFFIESP